MTALNELTDRLTELTERESLIVQKWAEGLTYREIAELLCIAPSTVRSHLKTIYKKLGVHNKPALITLLNHPRELPASASVPATIDAPPPVCPYPGMRPYQAEDAVFFYGREAEIQRMLQHLHQQRFLMVIGPSGSGKSSLVHAGLLPKLVQSRYFEPDFWLIRTMRPGVTPSATLAKALASSAEVLFEHSTIQALLAEHPPARRLLLVVDQFEEVFTQAPRPARKRYLAQLQALRGLENCAVLLTVRADFYPELMTSTLWPIDPSQRTEIAPLRGGALREAIEKPAAVVGVTLEYSLVNQLLSDAADEPGVLPLLQETMRLLWQEMTQRTLSLSAYEQLSQSASIGNTENLSGLTVAMALKADATLAELNSNQQSIARRIFLRLIQFGEGRADTRRQQPITALQTAKDDTEAFEQTLEHLTAHRLLTRSGGEGGQPPAVDIAHEALINGWSRLQDWADERREAEQIRRRLEGKAAEWVRLGQGSGGLLSAVELPEAEHWLASPDAAELGYDVTLPELVAASQQAIEEAAQALAVARQQELRQAEALAEEQRRRIEAQNQAATRMRRSMFGLATVLLIAVAAGFFAWAQSQKAQVLAEQEAAAREQAEARRLEAEQARLETERLAQAETEARAQAERLHLVSVAQLLLKRALEQQALSQNERSALLARHAYLYSRQEQGGMLNQVDQTLRTLLNRPYFARVIREYTKVALFSPDGKTLFTAGGYGKVALWDLTVPGAVPVVLRENTNAADDIVWSLALSPNGKYLASGHQDQTIRLWDLENLALAPTILRGHQGSVWSLVFSSDGGMLISGSRDNTVRLWDLAQPTARTTLVTAQEIPVHPEPPTAQGGPQPGGIPVALSPNGETLALGSPDGSVQLLALADLNASPRILRGHEAPVWGVAFSPDGKTLASASEDASIRLWHWANPGTPPQVLRGHKKTVRSVAFSADGQTLASGSADQTIGLWDLAVPDRAPNIVSAHSGSLGVYSVAFSPDSRTLASGAYGYFGLRLWDLAPTALPSVLQNYQDGIWSLAFSPDGKTLASGSFDGTVQLWTLAESYTSPTVLGDHEDVGRSVMFSPDGRGLATGSNNGNVRLWGLDEPSAEPIALHGHESMVGSIAFSPDGKTLASGSLDGLIHLWDVMHPMRDHPILRPSFDDWISEIAFSPDGKTLAAASFDGTVHLFALDNLNAPAIVLHSKQAVGSVAFSPDGKNLATGTADRLVHLWDLTDPALPMAILQGSEGPVVAVRFSPDGAVLAAGGENTAVLLWDLNQLDAVPVSLPASVTDTDALAFSPDGKTLATSDQDGRIQLYDLTHPLIRLPLKGVVDLVCKKVWRNLSLNEWHQFVSKDLPYERTCPNLPIHPSLFETAEKRAKEGDQVGALALLERAVQLDPSLGINPTDTVERWLNANTQ